MSDEAPEPPEESQPDDALQLFSDGDGLALIGNSAAVERFLVSQGLGRESSRELSLKRLLPAFGDVAELAVTGSQIATESGRWVKMTEESARMVKQYGLMTHNETGLQMGVIYAKGQAQGIKALVKFEPGPLASALTSPAMLAGAAGIMAQVAMQQTMDEIIDYLARIDEKVDDILRAQKDAVLADMIGVDLVIEEAMTVREKVGRVGDTTWSKVQGTSMTIARTQAYALRQLDALTQKAERKADIGDLANLAKEAETRVKEWLAVLARCFQLQEGIAVLELDRVLDSSPDELNQHRIALRVARENRGRLIAESTIQLLTRMKEAADRANTEVLFHPIASPAVVRSSNAVAHELAEFQERLGIARGGTSLEAKRWSTAAGEAWGIALKVGADGVDVAGRLGSSAIQVFQSVDRDGDGVPDKPLALSAVQDASTAITGAASGAAEAAADGARAAAGAAAGAAANVADRAANAAGAIGSWFRRKSDKTSTLDDPETETAQS